MKMGKRGYGGGANRTPGNGKTKGGVVEGTERNPGCRLKGEELEQGVCRRPGGGLHGVGVVNSVQRLKKLKEDKN